MKILLQTMLYFAFFIITTQILPKMVNPNNEYNVMQIIFLLIVSFGISIKDKMRRK